MNGIEISLKYLDEHCSCDQTVGYTCPECNIYQEITKLKQAYEVLEEANDFYCSGNGIDGDEEFMEPDDLCPFGGEQHGKRAREAAKKAEEILK